MTIGGERELKIYVVYINFLGGDQKVALGLTRLLLRLTLRGISKKSLIKNIIIENSMLEIAKRFLRVTLNNFAVHNL